MARIISRRTFIAGTAAIAGLAAVGLPRFAEAQEKLDQLRIDFATYSPLSILIKEKGWIEEEFKADGTAVTWVQSLGSNKALEFLNAALSTSDPRQVQRLSWPASTATR